ncbi:MAG: CHAP domain-containing protein [Thiotrichaceae bacterium]|nr:CHAP domain-containing protein [Thiotrichaceae bacterium]
MKKIKIAAWMLLGLFLTYKALTSIDFNTQYQVGDKLDTLNGVAVYYNGAVNHVEKRHLTADHYNLGLNYQCVEFVKRYYYQRYQHKMPDSYGHAKHFFNVMVTHGTLNKARGLIQYNNHREMKPEQGDLVVFSPYIMNPYGHVAIVSNVDDHSVEIIQQNPGPFGSSRERYDLVQEDGMWHVKAGRLLGWLRLPK